MKKKKKIRIKVIYSN